MAGEWCEKYADEDGKIEGWATIATLEGAGACRVPRMLPHHRMALARAFQKSGARDFS